MTTQEQHHGPLHHLSRVERYFAAELALTAHLSTFSHPKETRNTLRRLSSNGMILGLNPMMNSTQSRPTLRRPKGGKPSSLFVLISRAMICLALAYFTLIIFYQPLSSTSSLSTKNSQKGASKGSVRNRPSPRMQAKVAHPLERKSTCAFRRYPPRRYYGLNQKEQPDFLTNAEYIYGEKPHLLATKAEPSKLCVDQSEWFHDTERLPFADGTNPSILRLYDNDRIDPSILSQFPSNAKFLATICMTNSQCSWNETPQERDEYKISLQTEPTTVRNVILILDEHFRTLSEATVYLLVDAKYGRRTMPQKDANGNYQRKVLALDDARLFTNHGEIWVSYREGPQYGYDKQVLNRVHLDNIDEGNFQVTLKASETSTFCCGRNMALLDNVETNHLQSLTWVDPVTVIDLEDENEKKGNKKPKRRLTEAEPLDAVLDALNDEATTSSFPRRRLAGKKKKSDFHGTNGFMVYLPHSKEYLGIGHFHRPPGRDANPYARFGHHYTHAFFTVPSSPPFHLKRLSPEFLLPSKAVHEDAEIIQFMSGLELVDSETMVIAYGINDCEGAAVYIDLSKIEELLRDVPAGKEVVDLMQPLGS